MVDGFKFYDDLPRHDSFGTLVDATNYTALPDDWVVGTSDIVGSTKAIAAGKYKTVNMIGAAVISAQINAAKGRALPYIFGGDGAAFACPPEHAETATQALVAVQAWAEDEFGMQLRVAMTPVSEIRANGLEVTVARHQASEGVDYAMFHGGGISWAEAQMKLGHNGLPKAPSGTQPDLTGLSCRWSHMKARSGTILSIVIEQVEGRNIDDFTKLCRQVLDRVHQLDQGGHPAPVESLGIKWPQQGSKLGAHVCRAGMGLAKRRRLVLKETALAWLLFKVGLKVGGFDPKKYKQDVAGNADFRKFDDGLKMTIDCDAATVTDLREILDVAVQAGIIRYGLHEQDEAMMTCIVPSAMQNDHVHFIDGASGGYTQAAAAIKA
jgi:hypothetical protein